MLQAITSFIERYQRWFGYPLVVLLSMVAFGIAVAKPDFLQQIEMKTLDQRFKARGVIKPDPRVVILAIDDESLTKIGRWPWPRDRLGTLIERVLGDGHAAAMGFDIVFSEEQTNPVDETLRLLGQSDAQAAAVQGWLEQHRALGDLDAAFEDILKKYHDRLVLGYFFYSPGKRVPVEARAALGQESKLLELSAMTAELAGDRLPYVPVMAGVEGNIARFSRAGDVSGFFNFFPDVDGMVRRVPMLAELNGLIYPSLDLQTLRVALGWPSLTAQIGPAGVESVRLGKQEIRTDASGGMLLNHYGPARTFRYVSAADVLAGKADMSVFRDAIVLVGVTAVGIYDYRPSPFDSAFPGVEAHAAAISNILHQQEIQSPPSLQVAQLFMVLLLSMFCGYLVHRRGPLLQSISIIGMPAIVLLVSIWLFAVYGIWFQVTYLVVGILMATLPVTLLDYIIESRKRAFIHDAFSHYLAPRVVDNLSRHPELLKLGGEERQMTAMFSDIAGFSSFSEHLSPEQLVQFLNMYLTAMSDIILERGGTIDKYEGDAVIAFFGAPLPMEDHATQAVLAALEQQRALDTLRPQWIEAGYPEVRIRIGLNSGPMVVGNMGTQSRMNYTMMGDHVNLASRLEGVCKMYRTPILISRDTYDLVRDTIAARFVDRVRVVGRQKPVDLYEPIGERSLLPAGQQEVCRAYEKAWQMMSQRQYAEAGKQLREILAEHRDGPSEMLLERVQLYSHTPPPEDWDGVTNLQQK